MNMLRILSRNLLWIPLVLVMATQSQAFEAPTTSANSAILMELESGRVLYQHNADQAQLIASITKLMTALVALESEVPLQENITITPESCLVEGSSIYLEPEETITLEALLYGMMLHSGNDAATAIALACEDSVEDFVEKMNQKAEELGMTESSFANPHGLNAEDHHSSAKDMALLARACLEHEVLAEIVATKTVQFGGRSFTNKNKLLWNYEGCVGMKTGYTELAGRTLVSAATRDGMTLICVTLNDRNDWVDHCNLFDFGFETYEMKELSLENQAILQLPISQSLLSFVPVGTTETLRYPVIKGEDLASELLCDVTAVIAPVVEGQKTDGSITWTLDDVVVAEIPLVFLEDRPNHISPEKNIWENLRDFCLRLS